MKKITNTAFNFYVLLFCDHLDVIADDISETSKLEVARLIAIGNEIGIDVWQHWERKATMVELTRLRENFGGIPEAHESMVRRIEACRAQIEDKMLEAVNMGKTKSLILANTPQSIIDELKRKGYEIRDTASMYLNAKCLELDWSNK